MLYILAFCTHTFTPPPGVVKLLVYKDMLVNVFISTSASGDPGVGRRTFSFTCSVCLPIVCFIVAVIARKCKQSGCPHFLMEC